MQFTVIAAVSALAAVASASYPASNGTVAYTTEVVTAYTTYCPAATEISHGGITYTATEATTLTITNCPCTIVKPVTTSSAVYCSTCAYPTSKPAPVYPTTNATTSVYPTKSAVGTSSSTASATTYPTGISSSGADKVAFSGAALAGLLVAAAYIL